MLRFLVDAQLPPALARKLNTAGHEASHVLDVGLLNASDSRIAIMRRDDCVEAKYLRSSLGDQGRRITSTPFVLFDRLGGQYPP